MKERGNTMLSNNILTGENLEVKLFLSYEDGHNICTIGFLEALRKANKTALVIYRDEETRLKELENPFLMEDVDNAFMTISLETWSKLPLFNEVKKSKISDVYDTFVFANMFIPHRADERFCNCIYRDINTFRDTLRITEDLILFDLIKYAGVSEKVITLYGFGDVERALGSTYKFGGIVNDYVDCLGGGDIIRARRKSFDVEMIKADFCGNIEYDWNDFIS